ncbi:MAG: hypothetical protein KDB03_27325 [Planctomycetales bacterium]|nr:hypothetical protein [Planctomycetales bacterium]
MQAHQFTSKDETPLGLTQEGMTDLDALKIAISLDSDRHSHARVLKQVAKSGHVSEADLARSENEFLQFAVLLGISQKSLAPSNLADWYWHSFILDTRLYGTWCQRHFGRYLHHTPTPWDEQEDAGVVDDTRRLYRRYFGILSSSAYCKGNSHDCSGGGQDHCNGSF